jgi:hypothetical protein
MSRTLQEILITSPVCLPSRPPVLRVQRRWLLARTGWICGCRSSTCRLTTSFSPRSCPPTTSTRSSLAISSKCGQPSHLLNDFLRTLLLKRCAHNTCTLLTCTLGVHARSVGYLLHTGRGRTIIFLQVYRRRHQVHLPLLTCTILMAIR